MTVPPNRSTNAAPESNELSLLAVVNLMLRRRRLIVGFAAIGAVVGLLSGLLSTRMYVSEVLFLPQSNESNLSGLALAATQFGVRLPTSTGGGWGPPVYVELLQSAALLEPIALDSVRLPEEEGRGAILAELLGVRSVDQKGFGDRAVIALRNAVTVRELKTLNAVQVRVTTRWPSVSYAVVERLVQAVNEFNLETRQSQASAERQFLAGRVKEAEQALRQAEDTLQGFLQGNRSIAGSPELAFDRDRLQREVGLRQQLFTTLLQGYEEARVREVRDTPVITILKAPQVPTLSSPRRSALKAAIGLMAGGLLGLLMAGILAGLAAARQDPSGIRREFFQLASEMTPRVLRRWFS